MQLQTSTRSTVLAEFHQRNGASLGVWLGCSLPDHFGDWRTEYRFLRETVGVLDKGYRAYFDFTGPDRVRYLNAILTNNVKDLGLNHGKVSLFLNPQGHIQAELETYALSDRIFGVSFALIRERLAELLEKYIIMDDVTLADRTADFVTFGLEGPNATRSFLAPPDMDLSLWDELECRDVRIGGIACRVTKRSLAGLASVEFLAERADAEPLWNLLCDAARQNGGGPVGYAALNSARLEQGIPWFSYDFGDKQIPHEAGLQDSHIDYAKGCYIGQEIVERVRSRGQVTRVRVSLRFDASANPEMDSSLSVEGKEIGYLTRSGFSPALGSFIGMGYVRREYSLAGTQLSLGDRTAFVIATPIA